MLKKCILCDAASHVIWRDLIGCPPAPGMNAANQITPGSILIGCHGQLVADSLKCLPLFCLTRTDTKTDHSSLKTKKNTRTRADIDRLLR